MTSIDQATGVQDTLPKIAVVIPVFNAESFLERAVQSVFSTGYPFIEVVIVDDGSVDGTVAVATRMCAAYPGQVQLLRHPGNANLGVSASRNLGIVSSNSEWVSFLDGDDYFLPSRFDALRTKLIEGEAFDAIYEMGEVRFGEAGIAPIPTASNRFGIDARLTGASLLRTLLEGRCWLSSALTVRRSLLARTGGFDASKRIAEDCDLWFRVAAAGQVIPGSLERPVSVYWRHADNTFHYKPEHRVAMVVAMLDGWQWARRNGCPRDIQDAFDAGVPNYVIRSLVAVREVGRPDVGWAIVRAVLKHRRRWCLLRQKILRQMIAMLRGKPAHQGRPEANGIETE